jgi:hypothetical protein
MCAQLRAPGKLYSAEHEVLIHLASSHPAKYASKNNLPQQMEAH